MKSIHDMMKTFGRWTSFCSVPCHYTLSPKILVECSFSFFLVNIHRSHFQVSHKLLTVGMCFFFSPSIAIFLCSSYRYDVQFLCHRHRKWRVHQLLIRLSFPTAFGTTQFCLEKRITLTIISMPTYIHLYITTFHSIPFNTPSPCPIIWYNEKFHVTYDLGHQHTHTQIERTLRIYHKTTVDAFTFVYERNEWTKQSMDNFE